MLKKITFILLSALLLSACQLANPDQSSSHGDRFIGFYVTTHKIEKQNLPSTLIESKELSDSTREVDQNQLDGYLMIVTIPERLQDGQLVSGIIQHSPEIAIAPTQQTLSKGAIDIQYHGTLQLTDNFDKESFYFNKVFQKSNGEIYALNETVFSNITKDSEQGRFEAVSYFEPINKLNTDMIFQLMIKFYDSDHETIISEYDKAGLLIKQHKKVEALSEFKPLDETDFLILQENSTKDTTNRIIYNRHTDNYMTILINSQNNTLQSKLIPIKW